MRGRSRDGRSFDFQRHKQLVKKEREGGREQKENHASVEKRESGQALVRLPQGRNWAVGRVGGVGVRDKGY